MKKLLNLKIATFLLILGYSLPTHSMTSLTSHLKNFVSAGSKTIIIPHRQVVSYNAQNDVSTVHEPEEPGDMVIKLVAGLYTEDGITYGNEVGKAYIKNSHFLSMLQVRPQYRKEGYGKQLFYAAKQYCKSQGSPAMEGAAYACAAYNSEYKALRQNQLKEFYIRLGCKFTIDGYFTIDLKEGL